MTGVLVARSVTLRVTYHHTRASGGTPPVILSLLLAEHLPPRRAKAQLGSHCHGGVQRHLDF